MLDCVQNVNKLKKTQLSIKPKAAKSLKRKNTQEKVVIFLDQSICVAFKSLIFFISEEQCRVFV